MSWRWLGACALGALLAGCGSYYRAPASSAVASSGVAAKRTESPPKAWWKQPPPKPTEWAEARPPVPGALEEAPVPEPPPTTRFRLQNRLRVIVVEHHRKPIVMTRVVLDEGSAYDPPNSIGSTMMSTVLLGHRYEEDDEGNRIAVERSLTRMVWEAGGSYTYDVRHDSASFGIDGLSKDIEEHFDLLSKGVIKPRHGPYTFEGIRDSLIWELEELNLGDPETYALVLGQAAFGQRHGYGRSIYGTVDALKKIGFSKVLKRQEELLDPERATLLVVGDVRPAQIRALAQKTFGKWDPPKAGAPARKIRRPQGRDGTQALVIPQDANRLLSVCGIKRIDTRRPSDAALSVLVAAFGQGIPSRIGRGLRRVRGLTYVAQAQLVRRRHARALLACGTVFSEDGANALRVVQDEADMVGARPFTPKEIRRAKAQLIGEIRVEHEYAAASLRTWLTFLDLRDDTPGRQRASRIRAVSVNEVNRLARRIMKPGTMRFVLAGNQKMATKAARMSGLRKVEKVDWGF